MHIRPFMKLGCNPCFTKELQPNCLYISLLRFTLQKLLVPQQILAKYRHFEHPWYTSRIFCYSLHHLVNVLLFIVLDDNIAYLPLYFVLVALSSV